MNYDELQSPIAPPTANVIQFGSVKWARREQKEIVPKASLLIMYMLFHAHLACICCHRRLTAVSCCRMRMHVCVWPHN